MRQTVIVAATISIIWALTWDAIPGVNEAHYWTKTNHFWDPSWCAGDLFLESSDAHWLFYVTLGWLTVFASLDIAVLIGRLISTVLMAFALSRLCTTIWSEPRLAPIVAGLWIVLNRYGHLSGEWFIGGIEGKSIAYPLVVLAIDCTLRNRIIAAACFLGAATAMHPVVGIWSAGCLIVAQSIRILLPDFTEPQSSHDAARSTFGVHVSRWLRYVAQTALITIGIGSFGIVPAAMVDWGADGQSIAEAARIQVLYRLSHHLWLLDFRLERLLGFSLLMVAWIAFAAVSSRVVVLRLFFALAASAILISVCGAMLTAHAAHADADPSFVMLRLYWFRSADVWVPFSLAIALTHWWLACLIEIRRTRLEQHAGRKGLIAALVASAALLPLIVTLETARHWSTLLRDPRPGADHQSLPTYEHDWRRTYETYVNWKRACRWIDENTPRDATFLTPRQQQTFKWYAQRAEVVAWKDAPQDAAGLIEWLDRMSQIHHGNDPDFGLLSHFNSELVALARQYGATHLIVPRRNVEMRAQIDYPLHLRMIYPSDPQQRTGFVVFEFWPASSGR